MVVRTCNSWGPGDARTPWHLSRFQMALSGMACSSLQFQLSSGLFRFVLLYLLDLFLEHLVDFGSDAVFPLCPMSALFESQWCSYLRNWLITHQNVWSLSLLPSRWTSSSSACSTLLWCMLSQMLAFACQLKGPSGCLLSWYEDSSQWRMVARWRAHGLKLLWRSVA